MTGRRDADVRQTPCAFQALNCASDCCGSLTLWNSSRSISSVFNRVWERLSSAASGDSSLVANAPCFAVTGDSRVPDWTGHDAKPSESSRAGAHGCAAGPGGPIRRAEPGRADNAGCACSGVQHSSSRSFGDVRTLKTEISTKSTDYATIKLTCRPNLLNSRPQRIGFYSKLEIPACIQGFTDFKLGARVSKIHDRISITHALVFIIFSGCATLDQPTCAMRAQPDNCRSSLIAGQSKAT